MRNIPALTGLRFFAAALIVLWHSQTGYFLSDNYFQAFNPTAAVPLFFVLSGFVLTVNSAKIPILVRLPGGEGRARLARPHGRYPVSAGDILPVQSGPAGKAT
jgi:hypothetical protein